MTEDELLLEAMEMAYAKENLIDFAEYTLKKYKPNWHHYLIADRLEMLISGKILRLIINMPPRHGKSELASKRFPPFYFGKNKDKKIISVSYGKDLVNEMGESARSTVASPEYCELFPETRLSRETSAKTDWKIVSQEPEKKCPNCGSINWSKKIFGRQNCKTCGHLGNFAGSNTIGSYIGAGIMGGITGKGADLMLVDDPVKNRADAESLTIRDRAWREFQDSIETRLEDSMSAICLIQTRWHEDDITGRVLNFAETSKYGEHWELLCLPAIAEEDEEYEIYNQDYIDRLGTNKVGRKKGEALWPDKFPLEKLYAEREKGSYRFLSLYQQTPQSPSSGLFKQKNFRYADYDQVGNVYTLFNGDIIKHVQAADCIRFQTGDLAIKEGKDNDYTVFCTWELSLEGDLILIDIWRDKIDGAYHIDVATNLYNRFRPQLICIESVQYQAVLVQQAVRNGLPGIELKADKSKFTRALPASAKVEAHKMYFLNGINNLKEAEKELCDFPSGVNDDIVDNVAYAVIYSNENMQFHVMPAVNKDKTKKKRTSMKDKLKGMT